MIDESVCEPLTSGVTAFHEHASWTGVHSSEREAWLAKRRTMLTASEMACIVGESTFGDALSVFVEKTVASIAPPVKPAPYGQTAPLFWGSVLEQPILRAAAEFYGWGYREGGALLRSRHWSFLGCTLDAEIDRYDGEGIIICEGKTSAIRKAWDEEAGTLPSYILVQVQQQLAVTGAPRAIVYALLQGSRECKIEVLPSPEYQAALIEHGERFMDQVRRLEPPDPSYLSARTLEVLYPESNGGTVLLPAASVDWTRELAELSKEAAVIAKRRDELRNLLRKAIGNCTFGELPEEVNGKRFWRWIQSERAAYTVEARTEHSLLSLKGATMPGEKSGVRSVEVDDQSDDGSDVLAPGETVQRLRKRRR